MVRPEEVENPRDHFRGYVSLSARHYKEKVVSLSQGKSMLLID